jgi:hypothetical protein
MPKTQASRLSSAALALILLIPLVAEAAWYQIEIIVFSRTPKVGEQPEYWPEDPGRPDLEGARQLDRIGAAGPYARLPKSDLKLDGAYWSLRGAAGLKPLAHLAWRQPISSPGRTPPVYLASGTDTGSPELEGILKVSVSRFLHVNLDLLLRRDTPAGPSITPALAAANDSGPPEPLYPLGSPDDYVYRMQAHRRMRSGELHYIDHPLMGVLLRIDRYRGDGRPQQSETTEDDAEAAPETDTNLGRDETTHPRLFDPSSLLGKGTSDRAAPPRRS